MNGINIGDIVRHVTPLGGPSDEHFKVLGVRASTYFDKATLLLHLESTRDGRHLLDIPQSHIIKESTVTEPTHAAIGATIPVVDERDRLNPARAEVLRRFERIPQTSESIADITHSTATFRDQAEYILDSTKPGREQSAALTALEEAKFWTNQAIALNATSEERTA